MRLPLLLSCVFVLSLYCSTAQTTPLSSPQTKALEMVWIQPSATPASVEANKHVEVGFRMQMETQKKIENYLRGRNVPASLNPFDARDLDVVFTFNRIDSIGDQNEASFTVNGFFYRDYIRDRSNSDPKEWRHVEKPTLFNLRGRFTPQLPGTYSVHATVTARGQALTQTNTTYFQVQPSAHHGYLTVGSSSHYFDLDTESFFPVGQNIPWPECTNSIDPICEAVECSGHDAWCGGKLVNIQAYEVYQKQMKDLANAGGNYFRLLIAPWNLEIEFEELNNYDKRLNCAWEMDRIIEKAEDLDLLVHLNLHVHYPLEETSVYMMYNWDYADIDCFGGDDAYCYADELNLKTPKDFLESDEALVHYKNRIRYLISRYGYATSIGVLELFSEANNIGQAPGVNKDCLIDGSLPNKHPYHREEGYAELVGDWMQEIGRYIKEDLGHTSHILSVNYTGTPEYTKGDDSFYSSHIDLATWNNYSLSIRKYANFSKDIHAFQDKRQKGPITKENPPFLNKPIMFSEIGPGAAEIEHCDNHMRWMKATWISAFSGLAGSGMNWSEQWNPELWPHLGRLNSFMSQLDLNQGNYVSVSGIRKDKRVDFTALQSTQGSKKAMGVLHNATVNFYTRRSCDDCECANLNAWKDIVLFKEYREAQNMTPAKGANQLQVPNMGILNRYIVEWYNVDTGDLLSNTNERSNVNGKLALEHPDLQKDGSPLMLFKIYRLKSEGF